MRCISNPGLVFVLLLVALGTSWSAVQAGGAYKSGPAISTPEIDPIDDMPVNSLMTKSGIHHGAQIFTFTLETEPILQRSYTYVSRTIQRILNDPRGWSEGGLRRFVLLPPGTEKPLFRIALVSPQTANHRCRPLRVVSRFSCWNGRSMVLNFTRWEEATPDWNRSLEEYRAYMVNHEFGHVLFKRHVGCPKLGAFAPLMMQQTKGLRGCIGNGWPFPDAATTP